MDFIRGLPMSEGKSVIIVIVDRLTKYAHFCALSHPFKASTVSTTFMETVQKLHGRQKIIVSDKDLIFTGHFWTELFSGLGTQLAHISSYHPQSYGQTEIVNKCLEGYLHCFVSDKQIQWFKWLPLEKWWYNTSFHTATKMMTPFMALYGYHPPSITSSLKEKSKVQVVENHIDNQQEVIQILKDNLTMAQNRMKQQADQHRSEISFEVGDWVFLRLQPYKQMSLKQAKKDNKLSPKYYGPYKVLQNIGTMAYKLELLASSRVHPVFHVSLKKVIGDKIPVQTILPELDEEGKIILEPKAITDTRIFQLRNRSISEYLIKWRKLPAEDSTWEDESFIQKHTELLKRCGQHLSQGEGHVKP
jgi:hypothetical protein